MGRLKAAEAELPEDMGTLEDLYLEVDEVARQSMGRDMQACLAAIRLRARVSAKMEQVKAAGARGAGELSEDELVERLMVYASKMPDPHLRIFADVLCARLNLRIVPGEE